MFSHEQILLRRGARSGVPIILAVHSTALGPAVGGVRMWHYPSWRDGFDDALRLSASMTVKCAAADLPHGGGKTVVALPDGTPLGARDRTAVLHDVGDLVESLGGGYATGPDVGTSPEDMVTIGERTRHVCCRLQSHGGSGDSSPHTASGVLAAIQATCRHLFGSSDLNGRTIAVVGLGHVGGQLARLLAAAGARLTVTDIDPSRGALAAELDAAWSGPAATLTAEVDVLVPAALGGTLTADLVPRLRCAAIVGPANNQLAEDSIADALHRRGICWAPDYVVSAGGVCYALTSELHGATPDEATARVLGIGDTLAAILTTADRDGITPHEAARRLVATRLRDTKSHSATELLSR